jgi:hypothetical protein
MTTTTSPRRRRALVTVAPDRGCELGALHPAFRRCLSCPLPCCIYDVPAADRQVFALELRQVLVQLQQDGDQ